MMRIDGQSRNMIRNLEQAQKKNEQASAQLASGKRLVKPGVDPASLAIAQKMMEQITGINMANRNVQDGISMMQTAEGALSGIGEMTGRINELTIQAANDTYSPEDRALLQEEITQLVDEVGSLAGRAEFNNKKLLDGSMEGGAWIQSGANAGQGMEVDIASMMPDDLGLSGISFEGLDSGQISDMIGASQSALDTVLSEQSKIGAYINRMEYSSSALDTMAYHQEAAKSRIADADMAKASMDKVKSGILQQTSIASLRNMMKDAYSMRNMLLQSL